MDIYQARGRGQALSLAMESPLLAHYHVGGWPEQALCNLASFLIRVD